jgi:catechol 2,3-dioxygenase-like lactoylglutathione lyase family enzyme
MIKRSNMREGQDKPNAFLEDDMSSEPGPIRSISELALWVSDLERSVAFYRDGLGFIVEDIDPGKNAFLRSGDFLLVLFVPDDPGTQLASEYLARTGGPRGHVYHVAFRLDAERLDDYGTGLSERGIHVRGPVNFGAGRRSYFIEDPDEHYIELTDR